ncbi:MAG: hypothetical protein WDM78_16310 [Puia sp.]
MKTGQKLKTYTNEKWYAGLITFIFMNAFSLISYAQKDIYELLVYKLKTADQVMATDN